MTTSAWLEAALTAVVFATAGCGQSATTGPGGSDAGGGALAPHYGQVLVTYEQMMNGAGGGLSAVLQQGNASACTSRSTDACSIFRCDISAGGAAPLTNLSAGTITITGGSTQGTLVPGSDKSYSEASTGVVSFSTGATVGFRASGGDDIRSWVSSVLFPSPIRVTNPQSGIIDHTKGLALTWTGGSSMVLATIEESVPDRIVLISCLFDAAGGSGTIPPAAVSDLEPSSTLGGSGGEGDLSILSVGATHVSPAGFPVLIAAGSVAFSSLPTIQ